ncbi:MAG: hypothetical protein ACREVQ_02000 [Burkholderiales bacterium]
MLAELAEVGGRAGRFQATALALALLAGCAAAPTTSEQGARVARQWHSMPPATLPLPAASTARTLAQYQHEVAMRLQAANRDRVFDGPPPNPLRALIVLRAEIDALGEARRVDLVRAPWHSPELEGVARETLRRAEPFAPPSRALMDGRDCVAFTETWLFDYDDRFRLRSLAAAQAPLPPEYLDDDAPLPDSPPP